DSSAGNDMRAADPDLARTAGLSQAGGCFDRRRADELLRARPEEWPFDKLRVIPSRVEGWGFRTRDRVGAPVHPRQPGVPVPRRNRSAFARCAAAGRVPRSLPAPRPLTCGAAVPVSCAQTARVAT